MTKTRTITRAVYYFEILGETNFGWAVFKAFKGAGPVTRLAVLGAIALIEKEKGAVQPNDLYLVSITMPRTPFGKAVIKFKPVIG